MKAGLKKFFKSNLYRFGIVVIILINSLVLGLATIKDLDEFYHKSFYYIDTICLCVFTVEIVLKIYALGKSFFTNENKGWNIFDLFIVLMSIFASYDFAIFRAIRIFRALRLISVIPSMRIIFSAITLAIPQVFGVVMLLLIFYYIYGVLCSNMYGAEFPDHFGAIHRSLFTLFCIMTFDNGSVIIKEVMKIHPYSWIVFISFVLISTFIIMNLIIAIMVDTINEIKKEKAKEEEERCKVCNPDKSDYQQIKNT